MLAAADDVGQPCMNRSQAGAKCPDMNNVTFWEPWLRHVLELAATLAFALSGVLEGARKKLDPVGVGVVAFLAAFGGGTLRDLLLDQRPFFWVRHVGYVWGILGLSLAALLLLRQRHFEPTERAIQWPDAIGLGLFTSVGVDMANDLGMPGLISVMMGVITGVFGGVLRDIVCNEIPAVLRDHRPYAVCAFAGGWVYVALMHSGAHAGFAMLATLLVTSGSRMLALRLGWRLPAWRA